MPGKALPWKCIFMIQTHATEASAHAAEPAAEAATHDAQPGEARAAATAAAAAATAAASATGQASHEEQVAREEVCVKAQNDQVNAAMQSALKQIQQKKIQVFTLLEKASMMLAVEQPGLTKTIFGCIASGVGHCQCANRGC